MDLVRSGFGGWGWGILDGVVALGWGAGVGWSALRRLTWGWGLQVHALNATRQQAAGLFEPCATRLTLRRWGLRDGVDLRGGPLGRGGGGGIEVLGGAVVRRVGSATFVGVVGVRLTPLTYVRGSVWGGSACRYVRGAIDHGLDGGFRGDVAMLKAGWADGAVNVEAGVTAFVEGFAGLALVAADFGEELDGAVEAAGEMCVVAGELNERLSAADQHGSAEEFVVAFAAGLDGFGALRPVPAEDVVDVGGDDGRFDAGEALHSPLRVDDLAADFVLQGISRESPFFESGELAVEVGGVFAGEHGVPCEQAVLGGVFG